MLVDAAFVVLFLMTATGAALWGLYVYACVGYVVEERRAMRRIELFEHA